MCRMGGDLSGGQGGRGELGVGVGAAASWRLGGAGRQAPPPPSQTNWS